MELDNWQKEILATPVDLVLRSGRQVGKSTIISIKAAEFAIQNSKKNILIIASVERQAYLLFEKTLGYLFDNYKKMISTGKDKPTKHIINLKNGSRIYCLPTGLTGYGIRGYTIDLLIADEAAYIPEDVWTAVTPMLAATNGITWLLSTPKGKGGYFYECFKDDNFKKFHVSSEECPRITKEFLENKRKVMTKVQYAQEFLGEFVDELKQFFSSGLVRSCMNADSFGQPPLSVGDKFLGVDIARMGDDQTVFFSVLRRNEMLYQIGMDISTKTYLTETINHILYLDKINNYKQIFIDDGGMGVGVFDNLLINDQTKRKIVAINNASRSLDNEDKRKKKLLKEDLYNNLLTLMEKGKIALKDDPEIFLSLTSIQAEYDDNGNLKIFGNYSHITEALIRAAWCMRDKSLNIWIAWS